MEQFLLDTDICIFYLKDKFQVKKEIEKAGLDNCYISEITIAELIYGAHKSTDFGKHITEVSKIGELFEIIPIFDCFPIFAKEKVRLQKDGKLIPDFDLLIGATALKNDYTLITNNSKHFTRIKKLKMGNWAKT